MYKTSSHFIRCFSSSDRPWPQVAGHLLTSASTCHPLWRRVSLGTPNLLNYSTFFRFIQAVDVWPAVFERGDGTCFTIAAQPFQIDVSDDHRFTVRLSFCYHSVTGKRVIAR